VTRLERPSDDEIHAALARVLSSATFSRSERLRAFLSYVVTKDLAGLSLQLKGYTIAVDVFRRPEAFNADSDPLVRVHAGKLRKLLAVYDETEGADAPWRIEIPKGGYAPVYLRQTPLPLLETIIAADQSAAADTVADVMADLSADRTPEGISRDAAVAHVLASPQPEEPQSKEPQTEEPEAEASMPARVAIRRQPKQRWMPAPFASPIAMISILPLLLFAPLSSSALGVNPQIQSRLSLAALEADVGLPIVSVRTDGQGEGPAARLAAQVRRAMDYYTVIIPAADEPVPATKAFLPALGHATVTKSPLSFTISLEPAADRDQTEVIVTSDATRDVVSRTTIENARLVNEMDLLFESLGIAAKTLATNGDLFHYASDKGISSPLMECMLVTDLYRREKSREALEGAKLCQAQLLSKGKVKTEHEFVISASELKKTVHP
jgi:hypothetical protein